MGESTSMREIRLYGVTHALIASEGFMREKVFEVAPPYNLREHVGNEHEAVGLELCDYTLSDLDTFYEERCMNQFRGNKIFRDIRALFNDAGLQLDFLDDPRIAMSLQPRLQEFIDRVTGMLRYTPDNVSWYKQAKFYEVIALYEYLTAVLREQIMFESLARSTASVAFMGYAHALALASDPQAQETLGVDVAELYHIYPDIELGELRWMVHEWDVISLDSVIKEVEADELAVEAGKTALETEMVKRRHNAFSIGRVLDKGSPEPDYVGNFYYSGPAAKSLFELFIDERDGENFKGRICDVIGDAVVEGTISNGCVEFLKVYVKEKTPNPNVVPLYYGGVTDRDGMVRGKWDDTPENVKYGYAFCMHPFIRGKAMTRHLDERRYE